MFEECSLECLATFPECFMTFLGIFCNIPRNILRHSPECLATFPECFMTFLGIFYDIPQNILRHSPECLATFVGIFEDIHQNVCRHSPECFRTFPRMFQDIPQKVWGHSPECLTTFREMFGNIPRNITFPPFSAFLAFRSPFLYSCFFTQPEINFQVSAMSILHSHSKLFKWSFCTFKWNFLHETE